MALPVGTGGVPVFLPFSLERQNNLYGHIPSFFFFFFASALSMLYGRPGPTRWSNVPASA